MADTLVMASADAAGGTESRPPKSGFDSQVKMFSFFEELSEPVKRLGQTAWRSRGKLVHDVKAYILIFTSMVYSMPGRAMKVVKNPKLQSLLAEEEDPQALAAVVVGTGGALCLGSVGAVVGVTAGAAVGLALGAVPALFTLGLSLPMGAVLGGIGGLCVGVTTGSSAGFVGGATTGSSVAYFRHEIRYAALYIGSKIYDVYDVVVLRPVGAVKATTRRVREGVQSSADYTRAKAQVTASAVRDVASDRRVQVTAGGAGVGAAALGTAGAAGGALMGGTVGALIGVVPAVFTFGLSIPVGAIIGGSSGLLAGGAVSASVGFAGGATGAFVGYTYRGAPAAALQFLRRQVNGEHPAQTVISEQKKIQ